jgi:hypothetical protein
MAKFDDLFADVKLQTHNCPNDVIRHQLYNSLRDFLKITQQWEVSQDSYDLEEGEPTYNLNFGSGFFRVSAISEVTVNGAILAQKTKEQLDYELPDNWSLQKGNCFSCYYMLDRNTIRLYKIPDATYQEALSARLIVYPVEEKIREVEIPDEIISEWGETIGYGALWRLYKMPGKDWSNESQATDYFTLLNKNTEKAREEKKSGFEKDNNAVMRVQAW